MTLGIKEDPTREEQMESFQFILFISLLAYEFIKIHKNLKRIYKKIYEETITMNLVKKQPKDELF
jgi:hypothetical protein